MSLTADDLPFIEQIAELEHPLSALLQACGGFGDDGSRRRWAMAHIARRTEDEASVRWILVTADDGDSENNDILTALARNPAVPLDVLIRLAWNKYLMVSELAASRRRVPADVLEALASDGSVGSRMGVAGNRNTPAWLLAKLAYDPSEWVRCRVGQHLRCPAADRREAAKAFPADSFYALCARQPARVRQFGMSGSIAESVYLCAAAIREITQGESS